MLFRVSTYAVNESHKEMERKFCKAAGKPDDTTWWQPTFETLPNVKEITENDFWWSTMQTSAKAEVWCGQQRKKHPFVTKEGKHVEDWVNLIIYWDDRDYMADGGHAVLWSYNQKQTKYFTWRACDHTFSQHNIGNCLNRYTCDKCGATHDVDSSG